jgi:hypothetical protein
MRLALARARAAFNQEIERALDRAHADLRPLFDAAYRLLPPDEMEMLHELMFKLGMARAVLVQSEGTPESAERLWREDKARHRAALARRTGRSKPSPS